jgi:hypothetical protein
MSSTLSRHIDSHINKRKISMPYILRKGILNDLDHSIWICHISHEDNKTHIPNLSDSRSKFFSNKQV